MRGEGPALLSVVIPSRERADTLEWTLRSCVTQQYENARFLVSDNASEDHTREVVKSFRDPRVCYVHTGKRLSMAENWEFALAHVHGGYVMYLGDDDALLPGALADVSKLLVETGTEALSWRRAPYYWPGCIDPALRNLLVVPLRSALERRETQTVVREVVGFQRTYIELPLLYNAFVKHDAVRRVTSQTGRFFNSITPDVYSGFALSSVMESYYYSYRPYTIEGVSRSSNGMFHFSATPEAQQLARVFTQENTLPFHPKLVHCSSLTIAVAEAFLQAQDRLPALQTHTLDLNRVLEVAMGQAAPAAPAKYAEIAAAVERTGALRGAADSARAVIAAHPNRPRSPVRSTPGLNIALHTFQLFCDELGVHNAYEAGILCRSVLKLHESRMLSARGIARSTVNEARRQVAKRLRRSA